MKIYSKLAILTSIFLSYLIFINIFSFYEIGSSIIYKTTPTNSSGFFQTLSPSHSLTVKVKRARMFFGLLPTYIYFPVPKLYIKDFNLIYYSKWEEVRVKTINHIFLIIFFIISIVWLAFPVITKIFKSEEIYY